MVTTRDPPVHKAGTQLGPGAYSSRSGTATHRRGGDRTHWMDKLRCDASRCGASLFSRLRPAQKPGSQGAVHKDQSSRAGRHPILTTGPVSYTHLRAHETP